MSEVYEGSCHCRAIAFVYSTGVPPSRWPVRACQCAFCRGHGAACTSDPAGSIEFTVNEPSELNRYRFGLRTTDFLLCRRCGMYVGAVISTARGTYGIVNLNALRQRPAGLALPEAVNYDGESEASRVRRREERWTPVTRGP